MTGLELILGGGAYTLVILLGVRLMLGDISKKLEKLCQEDEKLWNALNAHGHKGLEANGNKVTR